MIDKPVSVPVDRGEWIFKEGDPGDGLYLIRSGIVQIIKQSGDSKVTLATLSKDEVFGEIAIFSDKPRMAGAIALVNSDLTMVPKQFIRGKFDASDPYFQIGLKSLFAFLS